MEHWSLEVVYKLTQEVRNGPVLVHCHAGVQRSATVVAMYLIANYKMGAENAMERIKAKRPIAFTPSPNFIRSIKGFEETFDKMIRPKLDDVK
jgi:protein-tyrosine phosphatase